MNEALQKPLPSPNVISQPFWSAAAAGNLVMQRCEACNEYVWTPRKTCLDCGSPFLTWEKMSGRGSIFTFTVIRQVAGRGGSAAFAEDIPYVLALVELAEGPRMLTRIVGCKIDDVQIGMDLQVEFEQASPDIWLPVFRPTVRGI
jgi:hypothetical protein